MSLFKVTCEVQKLSGIDTLVATILNESLNAVEIDETAIATIHPVFWLEAITEHKKEKLSLNRIKALSLPRMRVLDADVAYSNATTLNDLFPDLETALARDNVVLKWSTFVSDFRTDTHEKHFGQCILTSSADLVESF